MNFSSEVQGRLRDSFTNAGFSIDVKESYFSVNDSPNLTLHKIMGIVKSAGFSPVVVNKEVLNNCYDQITDNNWAFTIVESTPISCAQRQRVFRGRKHRNIKANTHAVTFLPKTTVAPDVKQSTDDSKRPEGSGNREKIEEKSNYFSHDEIRELLTPFVRKSAEKDKKRQDSANVTSSINCRAVFGQATNKSKSGESRFLVDQITNKAITEIILKNVKEKCPILEIGAEFDPIDAEGLQNQIIRIQSDQNQPSIASPLSNYQLDIAEVSKLLSQKGKKIPLFFEINTFSKSTSVLRKERFLQLSKLQNSGDRILLMYIDMPDQQSTYEHLQSLYPEYSLFPIFPSKGETVLNLVALVPENEISKMPFVQFCKLRHLLNNGLYPTQQQLFLKGKKVINFEEFFTETVKNELQQSGYTSTAYRHAGFALDKGIGSLAKVEKGFVRFLPFTDALSPLYLNFIDVDQYFKPKGISFPNNLMDQVTKKVNIFGVELLVIEATKI